MSGGANVSFNTPIDRTGFLRLGLSSEVRGTQNREFKVCVQKQKKSSQPSTGYNKVPAKLAFSYILSILVLPYLEQLDD